ncbi:MAG: hypothetical protein G01um101449_324 [Parcubacteria group bacterium Gr01-1014_49]|nr:MAG: hypothetical protein G01um101449_324 [Parcubacteria group bacterium Gr01-1014_49]
MHNNLVNLLPFERQKAISREYFLRLGVVSIVFVTALVLAAGALLLPTYVLLAASASAKQTHLRTIEASFFSTDGAALSARLAALSANAATLSALAFTSSGSALIRDALAVPHPGIALSNLSYMPAEGAARGTLIISGTALTRDALRSYQLALSGAPIAESAHLPVSAYAKDSNIGFAITVTLRP